MFLCVDKEHTVQSGRSLQRHGAVTENQFEPYRYHYCNGILSVGSSGRTKMACWRVHNHHQFTRAPLRASLGKLTPVFVMSYAIERTTSLVKTAQAL